MKGIVDVVESPGRPAVVHGVQHVYHAPVFLDGWPSADRRTRIVLIGENLRATWVETLIDLLDEEVAIEERRVDRTLPDNALPDARGQSENSRL
jgi:G3E family GTPase